MKLLGSTKIKINKDKKGENVPHLKITEVVLIHCNTVNIDYQQDLRVLYTFVPNKSFGQTFLTKFQIFQLFHQTFYIFKKFRLRIFIY